MIEVVVDDLAFMESNAIVRPANSHLDPILHSLRRLEQIGGPEFIRQLAIHDELAVGSAVVTGAGELGAEFVIHAVIQSPVEPVSTRGVGRALTSALERADQWGLAHIAIPPLGVGPGNLDLTTAARIMFTTLKLSMAQSRYPNKVTIVVETEEDREVFAALLSGFAN